MTDVLAQERERFLSSGSPSVRVRREVASSWKRCSTFSVSTKLIPPYRPELNEDCRLLRAARPVLDRFSERLGELSVSFLLTDTDARILHRRVAERGLVARLDALNIAPGFVFAEDLVGTNGVGTAVELGHTTRIDGHEHYAEELVQFSCVGVPLRDPVTGRPVGILDVTAPADQDNGLLTLVAEQVARSIEQRLFELHSDQERSLLRHFMAANRRSHVGIVVLNDRIQITNSHAARLLGRTDQMLLWDHSARVLGMAPGMLELPEAGMADGQLALDEGRSALIRTSPVRDGAEAIGVLVEIRTTSERPATRGIGAPHQMPSRPPTLPDGPPPGLAGTQPSFLSACRAGRTALARGAVVLCGEPGVGKLSLATALLAEHGIDAVVHDAAAVETDGEDAWLEDVRATVSGTGGGIVVQHVGLLSAAARHRLSAILQAASARGWTCAATATCASSFEEAVFPELDAEQVRLPPLRDRVLDIPALVSSLAAPRRIAPEAVQLLMRLCWSGNVRELGLIVDRMGRAAAPATTAGMDQVPPEIRRAAPRRTLTRFERAEVHAILDAVTEAGGNKKDAAALLGIARSTLYRKLQAAGVDLDNTTF